MDYETRRNIATILAVVSGAIWLACIVSLVVSRCGTAWPWVETAFAIVIMGVPMVIALKTAWKHPKSCTGIEFLGIGRSEMKDPEGLQLFCDSILLLYLTILTSTHVLMEAFDSSTFWSTLCVVSLIVSPLMVGYSIWTAIQIFKHNKQ